MGKLSRSISSSCIGISQKFFDTASQNSERNQNPVLKQIGGKQMKTNVFTVGFYDGFGTGTFAVRLCALTRESRRFPDPDPCLRHFNQNIDANTST